MRSVRPVSRAVSCVARSTRTQQRSLTPVCTAAPVPSFQCMPARHFAEQVSRTRHTSASVASDFVHADPEVEGYKDRVTVERRVLSAITALPKFHDIPKLQSIAFELNDPERLGPHDALSAITFDELGVDSLDKVELLVSVEKEFDMEFSDAEFDKFISVGQVIEHVLWLPAAH